MLKIFNTLTRDKAVFRPIEPGKVRMYVCGMTVYDYCHLGHARVMVVFDVVYRYLRELGYEVTYIRNITDIDDKIINRANERGEPFLALTERFIAAMHDDASALGVLPPTDEPRATGHMPEILRMIETLIARGHAYSADNGDVYYSVASFPSYGRLSGKDPGDLRAGARVEVGGGAAVLMSGLDYERVVLSGGPLGIMRAALDLIVPYLHDRKQFGRPIGEFQLMQAKLADLYAAFNSSRAYSYAVARACDADQTTRFDAAACLMLASENGVKSGLEAVQALGGNGYINDYPAGRLLRDAKLYDIGAGTSEIRRMLIGRELFRATT